MTTMRIKLLVLPFEERLCILCKTNSTVADLKANVLHAVQFYSVYKEFLAFCRIHVELKIDDTTFGIPDNYLVRDCANAKDTFVVSFVDQSHLLHRKGIHVPAQTVSDIQYRKMAYSTGGSMSPRGLNIVNPNPHNPQNQQSHQHQGQSRPSPHIQMNRNDDASPGPVDPYANREEVDFNGRPSPKPVLQPLDHKWGDAVESVDLSDPNEDEFDVSTVDISEIKRWTQRYMGSGATVYPAYHCPFSRLVDRLQEKFSKLRGVTNWESFLMTHCNLTVAKTTKGQVVQCEAKEKPRRGKRGNKNNNKSKAERVMERSPNPIAKPIANPNANPIANPIANPVHQQNGNRPDNHNKSKMTSALMQSNESIPNKEEVNKRVNGAIASRMHSNSSNVASSSPTLHPVLQNLPPQATSTINTVPPQNTSTLNGNGMNKVNPMNKERKLSFANALNTTNTTETTQRPSLLVSVNGQKVEANTSTLNNLSNIMKARKPPLRANPVVIGGAPNFIKKKSSNEDTLPTTPDSPSDTDNDEFSESVQTSAFTTPRVPGKEKVVIRQSPVPIQPSIDEKTESKDHHKGSPLSVQLSSTDRDRKMKEKADAVRGGKEETDGWKRNGFEMEDDNQAMDDVLEMEDDVFPEQEAVEFVQDHLQEILMKAYGALCTADCRYVVLHELERGMKNLFRDTTEYELDATDLNYVNFMQMLKMEMGKWDSISVEIVFCEKRLMSRKRGEQYMGKTDKIRKRGREYECCPEIETYVIIRDKAEKLKEVKGSKGSNAVSTGNPTDGDGGMSDEMKEDKVQDDRDAVNGKVQKNGKIGKSGKSHKNGRDEKGAAAKGNEDLDEQIRESIAHLARCNVVHQMTPTDIYWHIKLIHSESAIRTLEAEFNNHRDGVMYRGSNVQQNSFDEIATELIQNGISGARILEMKWSDWEMLHELYRFDRDHQDFVDELIDDFFFPFTTAEMLSNELVVSEKNKFSRQCMFDSERIRSKLTLCVDYGLFATATPILHYLVKLADFDDCQRLLRLHKHLSVDEVVGEYSAMHIAAWRGKFKLLAELTQYGGDPLKINGQGETAFEAGQKHSQKLKWFYAEFPQYAPK